MVTLYRNKARSWATVRLAGPAPMIAILPILRPGWEPNRFNSLRDQRDDEYAREAMHGIRIIRSELEKGKEMLN